MMIRLARIDDVPGVEMIVTRAYEGYIPRIGRPPMPMLDDYASLIGKGFVTVLETEGRLAGVLVLIPSPDHLMPGHLMIDNVAVDPSLHGRGFGRLLLAHAEREARRLRLTELRLYTHETMTENIAFYGRLGFVQTHAAEQDGFRRVFMAKQLAAAE